MALGSILVVDDNACNRKLVQFLLNSKGFEVRTAHDAPAALEALRNYNPDLILTDVQMPGMDGFELTRRLKDDAEKKDIRIVALTSYTRSGDEDKARQAGCDGYIRKPIDTRTFPDTVKQFMAA